MKHEDAEQIARRLVKFFDDRMRNRSGRANFDAYCVAAKQFIRTAERLGSFALLEDDAVIRALLAEVQSNRSALRVNTYEGTRVLSAFKTYLRKHRGRNTAYVDDTWDFEIPVDMEEALDDC